jgi:hypothetical protein
MYGAHQIRFASVAQTRWNSYGQPVYPGVARRSESNHPHRNTREGDVYIRKTRVPKPGSEQPNRGGAIR